jgi:predicted molibdopterin-dependent oxidoreductase YjgC
VFGIDRGLSFPLSDIASNIAVSAPHASHIAGRLAGLDFLVVSDFVHSETAAPADVVLPCTQGPRGSAG